MHCVEFGTRRWGVSAVVTATLGVLAACSSPAPQPSGEAEIRAVEAANAANAASSPAPGQGIVLAPPLPAGVGVVPEPVSAASVLAPPETMRSWNEVRLQAARRLVAAHPQSSFMGRPPLTLLAIPVLEVELNGDGSIRNVVVLRHPRQARDTTQLAIDALHRAAPFGNVSRLPRPWKFVETFLFDDDRHFKPRSLD